MPKSVPRQSFESRITESDQVVLPGVVKARQVLGVVCAVIWGIMLIALLSYDWRDISWLCNPPSPPGGIPANRLGKLGAWLTFFGYAFGGLAYRYFALPLWGVLTGFLLYGRVRFFRLRVLWMVGLYLCLACLFQVCGGDDGRTIPLLTDLNLRPNAGGAVGQWLVTDCLRPLLGTLGVQAVLWGLILLFLILLIGVRNCVVLLVRLTTPSNPHIAPVNDDIRQTMRCRNTPDVTGSLSSGQFVARPSFFKRIFRKKIADEILRTNVRDLLATRTTNEHRELQEWAPSLLHEPSSTPLFNSPTGSGSRSSVPEESPFVLRSGDEPILEPVSPLNAVTTRATVVNENDTTLADVPDYVLPSTDLLDPIPPQAADAEDAQVAIRAIESVFQQFDIRAHVVQYVRGPVLTQFEILPDKGVKLERFHQYERNLLMALRVASIRIQAPIPGRDVVGIEVPNAVRQSVTLREILEGNVWRKAEHKMALPLALGKLATGGDLVVDLAEMPHLLVAGGTGSGKSVALNDMLVGLLMYRRPDQLRLIMVDPKRVEFTAYDNLPHLLNPVVVESKKVIFSLRWAVIEMNRRYALLQQYGVRNIGDFNQRVEAPIPGRKNPTQKLPYIVIVIDELADLMLDVKSDIEPPITSLTQKARAAGLHMIIATQRPTTNVITGTIKANIPGRLALRVTQGNDSRTILDETGAERLIGKGDMLLNRGGVTVRSQAAWVSDQEIARVCDFIKEQAGPAFDHVLSESISQIKEDKATNDVHSLLREFLPESISLQSEGTGSSATSGEEGGNGDEELYQRALVYIRQTGRFSTSALQRLLKIGYPRAARVTDMLVERGIIGSTGKAGGSREILIDLNALSEAQKEKPASDCVNVLNESSAISTDTIQHVDVSQSSQNIPAEDFELGDLNPDDLNISDIIHPSS